MDNMTESKGKYLVEEKAEFDLIEDITKNVTEKGNIYNHPTEGLLVSYEYYSTNPNSDTYRN